MEASAIFLAALLVILPLINACAAFPSMGSSTTGYPKATGILAAKPASAAACLIDSCGVVFEAISTETFTHLKAADEGRTLPSTALCIHTCTIRRHRDSLSSTSISICSVHCWFMPWRPFSDLTTLSQSTIRSTGELMHNHLTRVHLHRWVPLRQSSNTRERWTQETRLPIHDC